VPDQALLLEFDEGLEGLGKRAGLGTLSVAEPEIDHVERIEAEVLKVLVDGAAEVLGLPGRGPAPLLIADRADLGHDVQRFGVRVQRFTDQPVVTRGP
jgi:hypothetical protein